MSMGHSRRAAASLPGHMGHFCLNEITALGWMSSCVLALSRPNSVRRRKRGDTFHLPTVAITVTDLFVIASQASEYGSSNLRFECNAIADPEFQHGFMGAPDSGI